MEHSYASLKCHAEASTQNIHTGEEARGISKRLRDIGLASFFLAVPMVAFTAVLIGLVFSYRVTEGQSIHPQLQINSRTDQSNAYFVRLNSTLLVFIASWSSSIAPILVGCALTLYSYPAARSISENVLAQRIDNLPTPYQVTMLLQFFSGGSMNAIWTWILYLVGWKQKAPSSALVSRAATIAILTSALALVVFGADTWLHVTTKTVSMTQITTLQDGVDYGFTLTEPCATNNATTARAIQGNGCILDQAATNVFLKNATLALRTLNNVSDTIMVHTHQDSQTAYLGVPPTPQVSSRDYSASTFGIKTNCRLISTQCDLNADVGASTSFDCGATFRGDLTSGPLWQQEYFGDEDMTSNTTYVDGVDNPFYFGLAALLNPHGESYLRGDEGDPELVTPMHGGLSFVLLCDSTVMDVMYDTVNGSLTYFDAIPGNRSLATIWQGAISKSSMGTEQLQQALGLATISDSSQEMADKFASAYSRVAMAVAVGAVQPQPAQAAQERHDSLVARVPKAPLYTLIVANLLFVVLGIFLTMSAWTAASSKETREIQARLSIAGLAANHLGGRLARTKVEERDELFDEYHGGTLSKVAIAPAPEGGYKYQIYAEMVPSI